MGTHFSRFRWKWRKMAECREQSGEANTGFCSLVIPSDGKSVYCMKRYSTDLYKMNADGSGLHQIADSNLFSAPLHWKPSAKRCTFPGQHPSDEEYDCLTFAHLTSGGRHSARGIHSLALLFSLVLLPHATIIRLRTHFAFTLPIPHNLTTTPFL